MWHFLPLISNWNLKLGQGTWAPTRTTGNARLCLLLLRLRKHMFDVASSVLRTCGYAAVLYVNSSLLFSVSNSEAEYIARECECLLKQTNMTKTVGAFSIEIQPVTGSLSLHRSSRWKETYKICTKLWLKMHQLRWIEVFKATFPLADIWSCGCLEMDSRNKVVHFLAQNAWLHPPWSTNPVTHVPNLPIISLTPLLAYPTDEHLHKLSRLSPRKNSFSKYELDWGSEWP